jgi:hypothetical protein
MTYRAVDPAYTNAYPPGEVDIAVYMKDADSLSSWVAMHSGPPGSSPKTRYWSPVANEAVTTVAGRTGLFFDWTPDTGPPIIHTTAVFLGTSYVLTFDWWSSDAAYAPTVQQYEQRMLSDLQMS